MSVTIEYFSVNTPSALLLTYLRQYLDTGFNNEAETSGNYVLIEDLSKFVSENIKEEFPYPIFAFYILTIIEFAVNIISQDKNRILSTKADGELRIIDTGNDECSMEFRIFSEGFITVENKIIEHLSIFWKIRKVSVESRITEDSPQLKKGGDSQKNILGKYIKTLNYPQRSINTSNKEEVEVNRLSSRDVKIPNERNGEDEPFKAESIETLEENHYVNSNDKRIVQNLLPEEISITELNNYPCLKDVDLMSRYYKSYNYQDMRSIILKIPGAYKEWQPSSKGRWGPGRIKMDITADTISRYLHGLYDLGVRTINHCPIPHKPIKTKSGLSGLSS